MQRILFCLLTLFVLNTNPALASELVPLPSFFRYGSAIKLSGDGNTLTHESFVWNELEGVTNTSAEQLRALSYDGAVAVGSREKGPGTSSAYNVPAVWTPGDGVVDLPLPPGREFGDAWGVSATGSTIIGNIWDTRIEDHTRSNWRGVVWNIEREMHELELPLGYERSWVFLSDNGTVAFGEVGRTDDTSDWEPVIWKDGAVEFIDLNPRDDGSWPTSLSGDGNVIVGNVRGVGAYRWTHENGQEFLPFDSAQAVSADGTVVLGANSSDIGNTAQLWDQRLGLRELKAVLLDEYQLSDVADIEVSDAWEISDDRKTIVFSEQRTFPSFPAPYLLKLDWPIGPPSEDGDMNFDGSVDSTDVDLQMEAIREYPKATFHDLDFSGQVDDDDLSYLIKTTLNTWFGDANLDGEFNSADLVLVFQAGHYEDRVDGNSGWVEGDWNADGDFTTSDLTVAFQDGGYNEGLRKTAAVPEPSGIVLLFVAVVFVFIRIDRRAN